MVDQMEMAITQVSSAYKHSSTQPFINIDHFYMPVEHSYVKTIWSKVTYNHSPIVFVALILAGRVVVLKVTAINPISKLLFRLSSSSTCA